MSVSASIYTPDKDVGTTITINRIQDTNNFDFLLISDEESLPYEGTIYNFNGHYLELVGKVIDGWTMYRKD